MDKVSVIIAIYNNEKYVDECLKSITEQLYTNLEIIIVNDGSSDKSLEICQNWAKKDSRIKVFNNTNHGVSYSRNFGIRKSTGEYCVFIDSDDIIAPNFVSTLLSSINDYNADCSACGIKSFYNNNEISYNDDEETILYDGDNLKVNLFDNMGGFLANKIYKSKIIKDNKLFLNENIAVSEDLLFNWNYFNYCKKITYSKGDKYFYRKYAESSYNKLDSKKWFSILDVYPLMINDLKQNETQLKRAVIYNFSMTILEANYRLKFVKDDNDLLMKIKSQKKKYINYKFFRIYTLKQKCKLIAFILFPSIVMKYKRRNLEE